MESDFVLFIIMLSGFFTDIACPWNKPAVMAYRYYLHTHHNGKYERDVLVYSNEAILELFQSLYVLNNSVPINEHKLIQQRVYIR